MIHGNRVKETTTTTGTGNLTLAGASTNFITFNTMFGTNRYFPYIIIDDTNNVWECGIGYLSGTTTLVRDSVTSTSSDAGDGTATALTLSAGTKTVICGPHAASVLGAVPGLLNKTNGTMHPFHTQAGSAVALTADRCYHTPRYVMYAGTYDAGIISVTTAQASSVARIGIYEIDAPGGYPGRLIAETSNIDTSTTGVKTATFGTSVFLTPSWYFVSLIVDAAISVDSLQQYATSGGGPLSADSTFMNQHLHAYEDSASWTAMPNPGSTTPTESYAQTPIILLRAT